MRVGIIGAGFVAGFHLRALRSVRGVEVSAIFALKGADELCEKAIAYGVGASDITVCENIADLCKRSEVVCLFLPNYARLDAVKQIVAADGQSLLGIIAEKPLARNVAEASEIIDLLGSRPCFTAYFENQIFMPSVTGARLQLQAIEKQMGPPNLIRTAEEHGGPHEPWFWQPKKQGGGVWCDMGCHSVAVGEELATPIGGPRLIPRFVTANMGLLKWGRSPWLEKLSARGVDYSETGTPAEDYANVSFTFEGMGGMQVTVQATDSWMYEAPGLRLLMEAMGPGYALNVNTLQSPSGIFISDTAAQSVADAELALEKSQASRGQLIVQPDEASLYGYVEEWRDAVAAFRAGRNAQLDFAYGANVVKLVMAAYMSHERGQTIDLKRGEFLSSADLFDFVPLIQQGRGNEVLRR
jgi:predicted dehydrogenase